MPEVRINETDLTTSTQVTGVQNIVYVPGVVVDESGKGIVFNHPTLYTSAKAFKKDVGDIEKTDEGKGVIYAYELLNQGLYVLFEAFDDASEITTIESDDSTIFDKLVDKSKYDVRFITSGGYTPEEGNVDYFNKSMLETAVTRGDCIAVIDTPSTIIDAHDIRTYFGLDDANAFTSACKTLTRPDSEQTQGTYAEILVPWCYINTKIIGKTLMPGSFCKLSAYARSLALKNPTFKAVAGSKRGIIPNLIEPMVDFGELDCKILGCRTELDGDNDNVGIAINFICNVRPYGVIIYNDRTLQYNNGKLIASSFDNIRNFCSELKKLIYDVSRGLAFEQNDDILWLDFVYQISPLLEYAKSNSGISGYRFEQIKTGIKGRVTGNIHIVPIEPVEDFDVNIIMTDEITVVE